MTGNVAAGSGESRRRHGGGRTTLAVAGGLGSGGDGEAWRRQPSPTQIRADPATVAAAGGLGDRWAVRRRCSGGRSDDDNGERRPRERADPATATTRRTPAAALGLGSRLFWIYFFRVFIFVCW